MNTPDDLTGPVNLGNPSEISILELVEKVLKITKSRSKIVYKPLPQDDPVRRCPDITLAKKRLGWQPKTNLEDGLKKTIEYFKRILSDNPKGKEK
jgi:UDP-glucuronate decarboxylase